MVQVLIDDIFQSKAHTLVNPVNCVGVMGKGLALEFKRRFPDMFQDYQQRCAAKEVLPGQPYLYRRSEPPWIINFPTKAHWLSPSKIEYIEHGLVYLSQHYKDWGVKSLAVPALGCGLGSLSWRSVGPLLYQRLQRLEIPVLLYAPFGTPRELLLPSFLDKSLTTPCPSDPKGKTESQNLKETPLKVR